MPEGPPLPERKSSKSYYEILGVEENATDEEIKSAYRKLAKEYHPDRSTGDREKFEEATEAYHALSAKEQGAGHEAPQESPTTSSPAEGGSKGRDDQKGRERKTASQVGADIFQKIWEDMGKKV